MKNPKLAEPNFPLFNSASFLAPINKKLQQTGLSENRILTQLENSFKAIKDERSKNEKYQKKKFHVVPQVPLSFNKSYKINPLIFICF